MKSGQIIITDMADHLRRHQCKEILVIMSTDFLKEYLMHHNKYMFQDVKQMSNFLSRPILCKMQYCIAESFCQILCEINYSI